MQFDKFTMRAQEAVRDTQTIAEEMRNSEMLPGHLLLALVRQEGGVVRSLLAKVGVSSEALASAFTSQLEKAPKVEGAAAQIYMSQAMKKALDAAFMKSREMGDEYLSTEHLLLGVMDAADSHVRDVLKEHGLTSDAVLEALRGVRGAQKVTDPSPEDKYEALKKYGRDLTEAARRGKLDPVIGRDAEIRRVVQVLSRRTKNNPVLIGEPGVGKTAIAEGLAQRVVAGDVPDGLKNKKVVSLDLGAMLAGAKYRGEFEDRFKAFLKEVTGSDGQIVLFIDELHTLVGAGSAEGAVDASNMIKPPLARGELRCIGATTLDEYRKHIEKDPALERRFQPVQVSEPSVEDTIGILRGLRERYEVHHGVRIQDAALVAAAKLSHRYISDRFLPDKAIDLMDEAASRLRMEIDSVPVEIDEVERRITQFDIEKEALKKEKDEKSRERLKRLEAERARLDEDRMRMRLHWQQEKALIGDIRALTESLDLMRSQAETAKREGDLGRTAEILYGQIPNTEKQITEAQKKLSVLQKDVRMLKEEVDEEDIADVVSAWTRIPVAKLLQTEKEKLLQMEEHLQKRVVGQRDAVAAVSNAVRRARAGLQDPNRPIGSFIFLGPTGVGKTELARALAEFLFDDEHAMVRIDMSEFMEKHSVSRLIGAPPGYVGYDEGGYLTEHIRRKPYSVVLFDEIEKAHPEVFNVLLQILDDGRLTDGQGRTVDFTNAVLVMTSNIGGGIIHDTLSMAESGRSEEATAEMERKVLELLRAHFRPEFLNRIDETIIFHSLSREDLRAIVDIQLERLAGHLKEHEIHIELTEAARELLIRDGYDSAYGARPLKREIQKKVMNVLAEELLSGRIAAGDRLIADVAKETPDRITFAPAAS